MPESIYLETSIVGHVAGPLSQHVRTLGHQLAARLWWEHHRHRYDLFISEFVLAEIAEGHNAAVEERLALVSGIPIVAFTAEARDLGERLVREHLLPTKARIDAYHVAIAATNGLAYVLTWNCKHIANALVRPRIETALRLWGYTPPTLCTPDELLEDSTDD